jgi:hypothetical protein
MIRRGGDNRPLGRKKKKKQQGPLFDNLDRCEELRNGRQTSSGTTSLCCRFVQTLMTTSTVANFATGDRLGVVLACVVDSCKLWCI